MKKQPDGSFKFAQLIITQLTENAINYIAHFVKVITFILCDE